MGRVFCTSCGAEKRALTGGWTCPNPVCASGFTPAPPPAPSVEAAPAYWVVEWPGIGEMTCSELFQDEDSANSFAKTHRGKVVPVFRTAPSQPPVAVVESASEALRWLEDASVSERILLHHKYEEWANSPACGSQSYPAWLAGQALPILRASLPSPAPWPCRVHARANCPLCPVAASPSPAQPRHSDPNCAAGYSNAACICPENQYSDQVSPEGGEARDTIPENVLRAADAIAAYPEAYQGYPLILAKYLRDNWPSIPKGPTGCDTPLPMHCYHGKGWDEECPRCEEEEDQEAYLGGPILGDTEDRAQATGGDKAEGRAVEPDMWCPNCEYLMEPKAAEPPREGGAGLAEKQRDALVAVLADAAGWEDRSYAHAIMHARNLILNLKAEAGALREGRGEGAGDKERGGEG